MATTTTTSTTQPMRTITSAEDKDVVAQVRAGELKAAAAARATTISYFGAEGRQVLTLNDFDLDPAESVARRATLLPTKAIALPTGLPKPNPFDEAVFRAVARNLDLPLLDNDDLSYTWNLKPTREVASPAQYTLMQRLQAFWAESGVVLQIGDKMPSMEGAPRRKPSFRPNFRASDASKPMLELAAMFSNNKDPAVAREIRDVKDTLLAFVSTHTLTSGDVESYTKRLSTLYSRAAWSTLANWDYEVEGTPMTYIPTVDSDAPDGVFEFTDNVMATAKRLIALGRSPLRQQATSAAGIQYGSMKQLEAYLPGLIAAKKLLSRLDVDPDSDAGKNAISDVLEAERVYQAKPKFEIMANDKLVAAGTKSSRIIFAGSLTVNILAGIFYAGAFEETPTIFQSDESHHFLGFSPFDGNMDRFVEVLKKRAEKSPDGWSWAAYSDNLYLFVTGRGDMDGFYSLDGSKAETAIHLKLAQRVIENGMKGMRFSRAWLNFLRIYALIVTEGVAVTGTAQTRLRHLASGTRITTLLQTELTIRNMLKWAETSKEPPLQVVDGKAYLSTEYSEFNDRIGMKMTLETHVKDLSAQFLELDLLGFNGARMEILGPGLFPVLRRASLLGIVAFDKSIGTKIGNMGSNQTGNTIRYQKLWQVYLFGGWYYKGFALFLQMAATHLGKYLKLAGSEITQGVRAKVGEELEEDDLNTSFINSTWASAKFDLPTLYDVVLLAKGEQLALEYAKRMASGVPVGAAMHLMPFELLETLRAVPASASGPRPQLDMLPGGGDGVVNDWADYDVTYTPDYMTKILTDRVLKNIKERMGGKGTKSDSYTSWLAKPSVDRVAAVNLSVNLAKYLKQYLKSSGKKLYIPGKDRTFSESKTETKIAVPLSGMLGTSSLPLMFALADAKIREVASREEGPDVVTLLELRDRLREFRDKVQARDVSERMKVRTTPVTSGVNSNTIPSIGAAVQGKTTVAAASRLRLKPRQRLGGAKPSAPVTTAPKAVPKRWVEPAKKTVSKPAEQAKLKKEMRQERIEARTRLRTKATTTTAKKDESAATATSRLRVKKR